MRIDDGIGRGYQALVDSDNRLAVQSITRSEHLDAAEKGLGYFFTSGAISLTTTASESGLFYIKNTSANDFHIESVEFTSSQSGVWSFYKNTTSGTLVSGAVAGTVTNANFTSANVFVGDVYKGADANTITDGTAFHVHIGSEDDIELGGAMVLESDNSMAIGFNPDAAATVSINILGYYVIG